MAVKDQLQTRQDVVCLSPNAAANKLARIVFALRKRRLGHGFVTIPVQLTIMET
ncbi:MAG: hypothetical protein ABSE69_05725 [Roseiarcus sp.]